MLESKKVDIHIGNRLRFARIVAGMSQDAVGEALGVTFQQIQKYEKGINSIRAGKLLTLAKILKVDISFFFEDFYSLDSIKPPFTTNIIASPDMTTWIQAFGKLDDVAIRHRLIDLVNAMGENHD